MFDAMKINDSNLTCLIKVQTQINKLGEYWNTVGKKNATEQKLGEVSSDLDLLRYDEAKNSSM